MHVGLSMLATYGLVTSFLPWLLASRLVTKLTSHPRYTIAGLERFFLFVVLVFLSISNFYLLADVSITSALRQPSPFFRTEAEIWAVDWLQENAHEGDVILASSSTGNFLAARVANPIVIGHWAETPDYAQKILEFEKYFAPETPDDWRQLLLSKYGVDYLWYGPIERRLGEYDPATAQFLEPSYNREGIAIYSFR
jgi:uncharacterized membrane protein